MDKSGNSKTITIKINGKDRSTEKEKQIGECENNHEQQKNSASAPYKELENIASQELSAAEQVKEEDDFDWILPDVEEQEQLQEYKIMSQSKGKGGGKKGNPIRNKGIVPSILLIVFLAVLSGTTLGVLMLNMVISDSMTEAVSGPVEETPPEEKANPTGTAVVELPALTSYLVQGGVFSTADAANVEAATMTKKGLPAKVIEIDQQFFLFVGVADNLENAKSLGSHLQESGIDTFSKEIAIGGGSLSQLQASERSLLEAAPNLYKLLLEICTTAHLSNSMATEQKNALAAQINQWKELENIQNEQLQQLKGELEGAANLLSSYSENHEQETLGDVQQHLLNFLSAYQAL
ncbi:hypothetical protein PZE06_01640 [Robertmurraya sp. DFI.2.37]|uniref:hypothetical protein n=1 Tax=Robertmurraya sp. DFI.2.37 TaxID=3031819 RepID=UPI001247A840|nr:hypothetical protein [Robertmurraya sp. DFI.2.37]MDF1506877.1 hypothetical protein [Robertmurraya sp. DFI.2.37]